MDEILSKVKKVHLVGIGGVGMSGLALLLKERGFQVSGSDSQEGHYVRMLQNLGVSVFIGHNKDQLSGDTEILGYSSAINESNPEIAEARKRGIRILKRAELLAELCRDKKTIAIAGSHGKTTTTALLSYLLTFLGYEPTVFLGGLPLNYSRSAWWGGQHCVIEADESDGSFLCYRPRVSIITNIDREHLDYYQTMEGLNESFLKFALETKDKVFGWGDQPDLAKIIDQVGGIKFGWGDSNQVQGRNFKFEQQYSCFDLFIGGKLVTSLKLPLVGEHNCLNSLAVFSYLWYIDQDLKRAAEALEGFRGTKRRFQLKAKAKGVTFIDDYAHHPTEIKAVIKAASLLGSGRIFVLFQPHRYSRINLLFSEFSSCFSKVAKVFVTDIYSAHEPAIEGLDAEGLAREIGKQSSVEAEYLPRDKIFKRSWQELAKGDLFLSLGAGDINILVDRLIYEFEQNRS